MTAAVVVASAVLVVAVYGGSDQCRAAVAAVVQLSLRRYHIKARGHNFSQLTFSHAILELSHYSGM